LAILVDTFWRITRGAKPVDYVVIVIELLVLLVILLEGVAHFIHWYRIKRRKRRLRPVLAEGQSFQQAGPSIMQGQDNALMQKWMADVTKWIVATEALLDRYSPEASASFSHDEQGLGLRHRPILFSPEGHYSHLTQRLNNLRNIIENADEYL
jgi:hypothetical protein